MCISVGKGRDIVSPATARLREKGEFELAFQDGRLLSGRVWGEGFRGSRWHKQQTKRVRACFGNSR